MDDPRDAAARYRLDRLRDEAQQADATTRPTDDRSLSSSRGRAAGIAPTPTAADRAAFVETAIQQAIRRGEFDDLPGAGKPLQLAPTHDPDWWIRRKIQAEQLRGLGPPALTLRVEAAEMHDRLDELTREVDVREHLDDFNRRVIEARRQLLGGPPVVTSTREVEADVAAWRERREARHRADTSEHRVNAGRSRRWPLRRRSR